MPKKDDKGIERARQMRAWAKKKNPKQQNDDGLDRSDPMYMASLSEEWLTWLTERNRTKAAVRNQRHTIAEFLRWSQERELMRPDQITKPILESYQRYLWRRKGRGGKPLAVSTQRQRLISIQTFFSLALQTGSARSEPGQ